MSKQISLHVKCMSCGNSLMDYKNLMNNLPSIHSKIKVNGRDGNIHLCSTYGCYDHESDIDIANEDIVEFYCPHCGDSLNSNIPCKICDAPMVKFLIDMGGVVSICSRRGCKNHYVMFEDLQSALRKFHREYGP